MPWGIAAGVVGSVAGAAVSGAMAPSTSGGSSGGSYYVPQYLQQTDAGWNQLQRNNINTYLNNQFAENGIALDSQNAGLAANNQYGGAYQNAANSAANQYSSLATGQQGFGGLDQGIANVMIGQGNQNYGTQQSLLNAGLGVYQTAMDPQNALYNRTAQQLQDQTGATNSMYGLGSSAAGAGVANSAMSNFNIDWQAQQLQNQVAGLGAYTSAANTAGGYGQLGNSDMSGAQSALGNASNMYSSAAGNTLTAGQLPYQTGQTIAATPGQLANTYGSYLNQNVYGPAQAMQSQAIPYMNNGQGAQALPYQNATNTAQGLGSTVSSAIGGIGNSIQNAGSLSNLYQGTTGSFGGGDFSNAFSSSPYYSGGGNSYGFTS